ncbi:MAG: NAAT family transporter [Saprospiraceae bacterium]|nr:NAAT family transporter [Saprospiraceae bacterium]
MDTQFSILSTALLLTFVLDPFGNVPLLLAILKGMDNRKRYRIIVREVFIGLAILLLFLFFGDDFLNIFHLETEAVSIAGGVIFFIFGLKMIFPNPSGEALFTSTEEPMVVPIAMPMIAGPSALATLILLSHNNPGKSMDLFWALLIAWGISFLVFMASPMLYRVLRQRGLVALERFMGMLLLIMSIQMFIDGLRGAFGIQ